MPAIGYGTWQINRTECFRQAYELGYRHFDSATMYGNETTIGRALRGYPREELFLTSKLLPDSETGSNATQACSRQLSRWGIEYLDLLLIHWPGNDRAERQETWRAMERLVEMGEVRSIGVSNFLVPHLEDIDRVASIRPAVNQIEYHPLCQDPELLQYCKDRRIVVEGYSPFGSAHGSVIRNEELRRIGERHGKSVPQVIIRWMYQLDVVPLPRSQNPQRMAENKDIFSFQLSDEDMKKIAELNEDLHTDWDPRSTL